MIFLRCDRGWSSKIRLLEALCNLVMSEFVKPEECDVWWYKINFELQFKIGSHQRLMKMKKLIYQSKSTWGEQPVKDISKFTCICVYLFVYVFIYLCVSRLRYRPETWHIYSQWYYLKTVFFVFEKITLTASCLVKVPCHVDYLHISSIALFSIPLIRRHNPKLNKQLFQKGRLLTLQFSA